MSNIEDGAIETFMTALKKSLSKNDADDVLRLFELYSNIIEDIAWDVIPILSDYLTTEVAINQKELFQSCVFILDETAEKCNPRDSILLFLEQIEYLEDDMKFLTLLKPIRICFNKINDKSKVIEWCVSTIQAYIKDLPIPIYNNSEINDNYSNEEQDLIQNRIINIYIHVVSFIQSIVKEWNPNEMTHQNIIFENYITAFLISLLGSPFCYLCEEPKWGNQVEFIRNEIIMLIFKFNKDPMYFLHFMKDRIVQNIETLLKNDSEEVKPSVNRQVEKFKVLESEEIVPTFAYANFYFYLLIEEKFWVKLPQVYHPYYIFESGIFLVGYLVDRHHIKLIKKAFIFIEVLLKRLKKMSVGPNALELEIYTHLLEKIVKVMVYCESYEERKRASSIFEKYILYAFNMEARYSIILHLYYRSHHSGVLGLVTGLVKTSIIESLQTTPRCTYFFGNNLESLLKHACNLAHGSATDLIEISDEIIAGLNLLRFLIIRDRSNETGIWDMINTLEKNFLKPLRQGIDLSKAHWRTKIKDLEEVKNNKFHISNEIEGTNVILTVGNQNLPAMPVEQKLQISHQILCGLDVMESLLIRIDECIAINPRNSIS
ncbi:PREDICTED: glomulin-like [Polistes dominula]|uniref:Glomulin-like n=1 Tax=Polistes dominula TaxID=743375 RepID=A0ABM1JA09_POLDO|nr:PREDICTED: glomulin-like [Polistes dominula]